MVSGSTACGIFTSMGLLARWQFAQTILPLYSPQPSSPSLQR